MTQFEGVRDQLVRDLHTALHDIEELVKVMGTDSTEKIANLRLRAEAAVLRAKARVADLEGALEARVRQSVQAADSYAQAHPWKTAGIAAGLGAAIGAMIGVLLCQR